MSRPGSISLLLLVIALVACGSRREARESQPVVEQRDDLAEIIALEAKLYHDPITAGPERCPEACTIAARICELSTRICDLAPSAPKCTDGAGRCTKAKAHVAERCICGEDVRGHAPDGR